MLIKCIQIRVFLSILYLLVINSCNLITEPERIINENVIPVEIRTLEFQGLNPGQQVDGIIYLEINTDSIDFEITEIRLYVDNESAAYAYRKPYILELNTRNYSEGLHQLSVRINGNNKVHGMLNILYPPSIVLVNELYFDRTPPQAVTLSVSKSEDGKKAILNWTESTNLNFAAYRIYRSYKQNIWEIIDTVYQKTQTSYNDSTIIEVHGLNVNYKVEIATNLIFNYPYVQQSNEENMFYGKILDYPGFFGTGLRNIVLNKQVSELYFIGSSRLVAFSTENQGLLKNSLIPNVPAGYPYGCFNISMDNSKLFMFNPQTNTITIIATEDFSVIKTLNLNFEPSGGNNETNIYHLGGNEVLIITTDGVLRTINTETGAVIDSSEALPETGYRASAITDDRNFVILSQSDFYNTKFKIVVRDVTAPGFPVVNEKITSYYYFKLQVSPDGQKLYGIPWSGEIEIRDLSSLEVISSIGSGNIFHSFILDNHRIYTTRYKQISFPGGSLGGQEILAFNVTSYELEKSWVNISEFQSELVVSMNHLFMRCSSQNTIGLAINLDN